MSQKTLRRNSLRYPGYDYSQSASIFVTITTHERQRLFGTVRDGIVVLSPAGTCVFATWQNLGERFPDVTIDGFVVMPDHLHGIIMTGTNPNFENSANTLGFVIRSFKTTVQTAWRAKAESQHWPRYQIRLWQRDFYDRIIRNEAELHAYREYIEANPARWEEKHGG